MTSYDAEVHELLNEVRGLPAAVDLRTQPGDCLRPKVAGDSDVAGPVPP